VSREKDKFTERPFPKVRQPIIDALRRAKNMNVIHALLEIDVTDSRRLIREFRKKTGKPLSFTTFLIFCLAQAIDENKMMQAYRSGGRLIIYDDVDVAVDIERDFSGEKSPIYPHVIKAANTKTMRQIHDEVSEAVAENLNKSSIRSLVNLYWYSPGFIRSILWRRWLGSAAWRKRLTGTVGLSAVGMFGKGPGWGIPISTYTLSITVGAISVRPALIDGQLQEREYLALTASFDHDIIDGAPAARFGQRLREYIESGHGLKDSE
jgi:pyruvate/2-oxoglutarate dehydrogenase complex dihydrolipoamide acyltransferase (E2) component